MTFDVVHGSVKFGSKMLAGNMSFSDALAQGFIFEREIDMKTGWIFRTASEDGLDGHIVTPALGFQSDKLKKVSVTFFDEDGSVSEHHREFLMRELGAPTKVSPTQTLYAYSWGRIAAEQDPRDNSSHIIITWQ